METKEELYNVYIDESGDEGIKKGSQYFIITAVIVKNDNDLKIANKIKCIKNDIEIFNNQLHWNQIKGIPNKKFIINEISTEQFTIIHLIVDTYSINYLKSKDIYYKYFCYLMERIFIYIKDNKINKLNISSRPGLERKKLIKTLKNKNEYNIFSLDKIKKIQILPNSYLQLLQLADICSSSFHQSIKYDNENTFYFTNKLKNNFFKKNNKLFGYGIKLVPNKGNFEKIYNLNLEN